MGKYQFITHIFIYLPTHIYYRDNVPEVAVCDERGRISIGKEATDKLGRKFHVVVMPREIVLIPVSKNPLKELAAMGKKIPRHFKLEDLKKIAEEEAIEEAMGNLKRLKKLKKISRR